MMLLEVLQQMATPDMIQGIGVGVGAASAGIGLAAKFVRSGNGSSEKLGRAELLLQDVQGTSRTVSENQVELAHHMADMAKVVGKMSDRHEQYLEESREAHRLIREIHKKQVE